MIVRGINWIRLCFSNLSSGSGSRPLDSEPISKAISITLLAPPVLLFLIPVFVLWYDNFTATWVQAIGSVLAILVAVYVFSADHHRQERQKEAEKNRVAQALLIEMFHALKFLAAGHDTLTEISNKSEFVRVLDISQAYPSRRPIYATIGPNIGVLSEQAAMTAVNFDHFMQALERTFEHVTGQFHISSKIDSKIALQVADSISKAIKSMTLHWAYMLIEVYGDKIPEAREKELRFLNNLFESNVS